MAGERTAKSRRPPSLAVPVALIPVTLLTTPLPIAGDNDKPILMV